MSSPQQQRIGYLGPPGTFTEQALLRVPKFAELERVPFTLLSDVLFGVTEGVIDFGIVPVENAIEGTVNASIDTLAFDVDLMIQHELVEQIHMNLLVVPGTTLADVKKIRSIPVATAQCRAWLRKNLPNVEFIPAASTAGAVQEVADQADPTIAAIGNERAGEVYGLEPLATGIEDHPENMTRFVIVSREGIPAPTGFDKSTIVVFQHADRAGSLLAILQEFAARSINLTMLSSRPTKTSLGDYCFVMDLIGHVSDPVVADCLRTLHATQGSVKYMGSYPSARVNGVDDAQRVQTTEAFARAESWITDLQNSVGE